MLRFFERPYPSANSVLLTGPDPVLVDTGVDADLPDLLAWLEAQDTPAATLSLIVNTHFHTDHVGGNHALQACGAALVAASAGDAAQVNAWTPDPCEARWLRQPIAPYRVDRVLAEGDEIATGSAVWTVLATPGHTEGHLSLFNEEAGVLVLGDALHHADIGWLSPLRPAALDQTEATIERLAALPARRGYSGHGPAITDLPAALARARRRLQAWRRDPEQVGWHACKRIFAHALILADGLAEAELAPLLLACPWFVDHARLVFAISPEAFVPLLIQETLRADAAFWRDGKLTARAAYRVSPPLRP